MASSQFVQEAGVSLHFTVWEVSITEFTSTLFVNSHPFYIHVYTRVITPFMTKASELSIQWYQLRWESLWKIETFPGLITGSVSGRPSAPQGQGRRPTPGATPIGNKRPSGNKLVSSSCSSCRTGGRLHKPQCKGMQQKLCRLHGGFRTFETRTGRLRCNKISGQPAQSNSDKSRRGQRNHSWPGWKFQWGCCKLFPQQACITKAGSYKWNIKHTTLSLEHFIIYLLVWCHGFPWDWQVTSRC